MNNLSMWLKILDLVKQILSLFQLTTPGATAKPAAFGLEQASFALPPTRPTPYPLTELSLFPLYRSQKEYTEKTGKVCPPWDPKSPIKRWEDASILNPSSWEMAVYGNVLAVEMSTMTLLRPLHFKTLGLSQALAARVNLLPDDHIGVADELLANQEILSPNADLPAGTKLYAGPMSGSSGVMVVDENFVSTETPVGGGGFTEDDRKLLKAIAAKVGA